MPWGGPAALYSGFIMWHRKQPPRATHWEALPPPTITTLAFCPPQPLLLPCSALPPLAQVWYCTQKGYKPWLEPNKQNTRTNEQGGHTTWYDEQELLQVGTLMGRGLSGRA